MQKNAVQYCMDRYVARGKQKEIRRPKERPFFSWLSTLVLHMKRNDPKFCSAGVYVFGDGSFLSTFPLLSGVRQGPHPRLRHGQVHQRPPLLSQQDQQHLRQL